MLLLEIQDVSRTSCRGQRDILVLSARGISNCNVCFNLFTSLIFKTKKKVEMFKTQRFFNYHINYSYIYCFLYHFHPKTDNLTNDGSVNVIWQKQYTLGMVKQSSIFQTSSTSSYRLAVIIITQ